MKFKKTGKAKKEQTSPDQQDCAAPLHCPLVALGASAGGLEVFQQFFDHMPSDSGMAFILLQHLDPSHETLMPELLAKHTSMQVLRAEDGASIQPNHVYVIAPSTSLRVEGCTLRTSPLSTVGDRNVIDRFLRSAALEQRENVVGIILSGTGNDGTIGLRAIKENGGLTVAQAPDTARYDSMPRSAISTGCVDHVITVNEMPRRILEYVEHLTRMNLRVGNESLQKEVARALPQIFPILRQQTGHDFSRYKQSTMVRRIQRRMQVVYLDSVEAYVEYLNGNSEEVDALFKDLLIGVTQFFRDAESFEFLAQNIIPDLFRNKSATDHIRLWIPGCASGEEAYSFAILLSEHAANQNIRPRIQIFATDLDTEALDHARRGNYPEDIEEQMSSDRLRRFFRKNGASYDVIDPVREMCVFSPHNVIKDPPFSRLDLISCRNLLIYLEADLQKKLLPLFHYALNPSGYLFLGPSENIASRSELFRTVDSRHRIFQRKPTALRSLAPASLLDPGRVTKLQTVVSSTVAASKEPALARSIERVIIEEYSPGGVVVNSQGEVLYFSGNTGKFLEPPAGLPSNNILSMARKNLRLELRTTFHRAVTSRKEAVRENVRLQVGGEVIQFDVVVRPLTELGPDPDLFIILFRELIPAKDGGRPPAEDFANHEHPVIRQLENELRNTKEDLQTTIEELETSNEELKSANEELLSMNEELQSANEELQTSKEEVQSANEELSRKIEEVEASAAELRRAHEDRARLAAIVQNSDDAIIGKTLEGIITSWNYGAEKIFGYSAAEMVGQSITKIIPQDRLDEETYILSRLRRGQSVEHYETERVAKDGRRLIISLTSSPIRDSDGVVIGAAKIARDITERKSAEEVRLRLASVVESSDDAIITKTLDGIITSWNEGAEKIYGYTASEAIGKPVTILIPEDRIDEEPAIVERIQKDEKIDHYETVRRRKDGSLIDISLTVSPIKDARGKIIGASKIARDITERKRTDEALRQSMAELQTMFRQAAVGISKTLLDGRIVQANSKFSTILGYSETELYKLKITDLVCPEDVQAVEQMMADLALEKLPEFLGERCYVRKDGKSVWTLTSVALLKDKAGKPAGFIRVIEDVSEQKRVQEALQEERRILEMLNETGKVIASQLNIQSLLQQVTDAATKLSGASFGAFFYNTFNEKGEALVLYTLSGAPREAFEKFGIPRATPMFSPTFHGEGIVRCDDVLKDPRYGKVAPHFGMPKGHLPVRSYLAVPVVSRSGEVIGGLFFGHRNPGMFTDRSERLVAGVAAQAAVAMDNARLYEQAQKELEQRKQAEQALQQANETLERRVKERTASLQETTDQLETFCYTIAHDLRSPLRAQQSFAQVLLEDYSRILDENGKDYVTRILQNAHRLDNLVADLLSYSRLSREELTFRPVDYKKLVPEIIAGLSSEIREKNATLSVGQLHKVVAYEPTLALVVINLVNNALKFVEEGNAPKVKIYSESDGKTVRLWVEDEGIGIAAEHMPRLFGVFQRLHKVGKYSGTGIGLAIVQKGIMRMGGRVGVESERGKGSRFWIELPAAQT